MGLDGKSIVITGATRGLGRATAVAVANAGGRVLAIGRTQQELARLEEEHAGIRGLQVDVSHDDAADIVFREVKPDILILNAGTTPKMCSIQDQDWDSFSANWEVDVKHAFHFGKAALMRPLVPGSRVLTVSSGAAIGGSFISGGYAGAKRMQWFLSEYCQRESDDRKLSLMFQTVLPKQQFRETTIGGTASRGYAEKLGITQEAFLERFTNALTPAGFADHFIEVLTKPEYHRTGALAISGAGVELMDGA